ncbi:MAG TPA: ABC transporter ATP-binding protein, partial [Ilumatobacteraceae bacterium]|nr:ABC transporter ATP-binding protein [Ilumatobacteraceae bacterium]
EAVPSAVECIGVTKSYHTGAREVAALRGVGFAVPAGSWVALMGASGSGKSTLLQLLGGLDRPDAGTISIGGEPLEHLSETGRALLRRRRIGYVFQFFNLVSNLTVAENVELPLLLVGTPRRDAQRRRAELLTALGIGDLGGAAPAELSGGQQQRVAMARALANRPDVLLADEPTGNLDSASSQEMLALLRQTHELGQTIVMVTHDPGVASAADRVLLMSDGQIVDDRTNDQPATTTSATATATTATTATEVGPSIGS